MRAGRRVSFMFSRIPSVFDLGSLETGLAVFSDTSVPTI
jgi:hypothetical protein